MIGRATSLSVQFSTAGSSRSPRKKKVEVIFQQQGLLPDGIAIHKDGRLFIACLSGKVVTIQPDGSGLRQVEPRFNGKPASVNDLVFDRDGNFYATDFIGTVAEPTGGVIGFPPTSHGLIASSITLPQPTASVSRLKEMLSG